MTIAVWVLSLVAIASAFGVVFSRQAVHSALCLTTNMITLAVIYLTMSYQFLAAGQMVIYAGAIMVVFLFAVTVLAPVEDLTTRLTESSRIFGMAAGTFVGAGLTVSVLTAPVTVMSASAPPFTLKQFAVQLFGKYVLPFECTAFVLLVALIGAVLLGHRRLKAQSQEVPRGH